ncbi:MAG: ECF transporter S component [Clostridia bacterium]|nr:ECF transporter S component [Clostridia bacterium]
MNRQLIKQIIPKLIRYVIVTVLICLATRLSAIELPDGAYIHIGDTAVYLAALLLPWQAAVPVCAIGCAAADIALGSVNYVFATVIIKALTVLFIKILLRLSEKPLTQDVLVCFSGVVTVAGYYIADVIKAIDNSRGFIHAMSIAFDPIMYNVLQALICAVLYIIVSGIARYYACKKKEKETVSDDNPEIVCEDKSDA